MCIFYAMKTPFDLTAITPTLLDELRHVTDPLADDTVAAILASGKEEQVNKMFMLMVRNTDFHPGMFSALGPELSTLLDHYISASAQLPPWADAKKLQIGERVFATHGPEIFMLLNVSSLPLCYCCAKGAQVLFETGRLLTHGANTDPLARRLMETAQMVVNVMSPGGMAPRGKGIVTTQKVRLIHASIRYFLRQGQYQNTPWDAATFGEPINQEDLTGTLMSFGPVILAGLQKLGLTLSTEEQAAYMHCWSVVGYLMGIKEELLPDTFEQGYALASKILAHQAAPSEAGRALTSSCDAFIQHILPGNAFDGVPGFLMEYFLEGFSGPSGKNLPDIAGVTTREDVKDRMVLSLTQLLVKELGKLDRDGLVRAIAGPFNRLLLHGVIHHFNDGKGVQFFIPPSLQQEWKMTDTWTDVLSTPAVLSTRISFQRKTETPT